jgi:hypothetical protein
VTSRAGIVRWSRLAVAGAGLIAVFALMVPTAGASGQAFGGLVEPSLGSAPAADTAGGQQTSIRRSRPSRGGDCLPADLSESCARAVRRADLPLERSAASEPAALAASYPPTETKTSPHGDSLTISNVRTGPVTGQTVSRNDPWAHIPR